MKNILYILLCAFNTIAHADVMSVKFDKDYYFLGLENNIVELNVTNVGKSLVFTDITLAPGYKTAKGGEVDFHFDKKITNYDVFPATVAIPAGQTRIIKLVRHTSVADALFATPGHEEFYRIRAIPKPADEALKANPELWSGLSAQEKQSLQDADGTRGTVRLAIGSGSVIIVQKNTAVDTKKLTLRWDITPGKGGTVTVKNNTMSTLNLTHAKINNGKQWIPLNSGGVICRPGLERTIKIMPEELKSLGAFMSSNNLDVSFTLQDGKEYQVKPSSQNAILIK